MGKPYREELQQLGSTTQESYAFPIERLKRAVEDSAGYGLVIVASGGSQTPAQYLAQLHQETLGHPCQVVTPLVFQSSAAYARGCVWLLSAGGRNPDILQAGEHAIASGAQSITALIASEDTPLQRLLAGYGASRTVSFTLAAGGDGFLATNSLWASCLLMERAYQAVFDDRPAVSREEATQLLDWAQTTIQELPQWSGDLVGLGDPDTMLGLADLEMRATEAALANVWVSDLRNLGHGRHYWFADRGAKTTALCLATPAYLPLADRTVELIGEASPAHRIEVPFAGSHARLASIAASMYIAQRLGDRIDRDPGRPGVPAFGEQIYKLAVPIQRTRTATSFDEQIVMAKLGRHAPALSEAELTHWLGRLQAYRAKLQAADIAAVVFDFDGTLIESSRRYEPLEATIVDELRRLLAAEVHVGIATGRGGSCGDELRKQLPEKLWTHVSIGYYNGAVIQPLSAPEPSITEPDAVIQEARTRIERYVLRPGRGRCRVYAQQCSVSLLDGRSLSQAWCEVAAALQDLIDPGQLVVWQSSHSIDIVSAGVSKRNVISAIAAQANCLPEDVLCIGDRGRWPGNDFELLQMPLSLSSDQCSSAQDRCWNLAGMFRRQVAATCYQLKLFEASRGLLRFKGRTDE